MARSIRMRSLSPCRSAPIWRTPPSCSVLALLFAEVLLAWHFGHYTATEGMMTNSPAGNGPTFIASAIAILSALVVGIGALIIIHARMTGDFLGFLPEIIRRFIESNPRRRR